MWTSKKVTRRWVDTLVEGLNVKGLETISEQELLQIEGGRAGMTTVLDEATRRLPDGDVQVQLLNL